MATLRPFTTDDLFRFSHVNLDVEFTETYGMNFYLKYLATWPRLVVAVDSPGGRLFAYLLGKVEGVDRLWHGHVTALTVAPEFRRLGTARALMGHLDEYSAKANCYFVDLFVRVSNSAAVWFYHKLGYSVYREIEDYYSGLHPENAFDMRKALPRDELHASIVPIPYVVGVDDLEFS